MNTIESFGPTDDAPCLYSLRRPGGEWGAPVSSAVARQAAPGLLGIHINLPAAVPPDVAAVLATGGAAPAGFLTMCALHSTRSSHSSRNIAPMRHDGHTATDESATCWRTLRSGSRPGFTITTTASLRTCSTAMMSSMTSAVLADEHRNLGSLDLLGDGWSKAHDLSVTSNNSS